MSIDFGRWRWMSVIVALLSAAAMAQQDAPARPATARIDAVFGRPVVFRVQVADNPPARLEVRLDDGHTIQGEIQWVGLQPRTGTDCSTHAWLPTPPALVCVAADDPRAGAGPGSWMMRLNYPLIASGQGFWLGGVRYQPNWLPDPRRLVEQTVIGRAWSTPLTPDEQQDPLYQSLIRDYQDHPLLGWRYELATDTFTPGLEFDAHADAGGPITDLDALQEQIRKERALDPIAQDLAELERARWQVALARLWNLDATLSLPVREKLAGAVETPAGLLPTWTTGQRALDDLLNVMLDPKMSDEERKNNVEAWLKESGDAVVWVVDDAGRQDGRTGAFLPTLGAVNSSQEAVLAWARSSEIAEPSDLAPLMPNQVRYMRGDVLPTDLTQQHVGAGVEVQVGDWSGYLPTLGMSIPIAPPGFALGPFRREWTLESWRAMDEAQGAAPPTDRQTAAMLFRGRLSDVGSAMAEEVGPMPPPAERERWILYIEARTPEGTAGEDWVEAWFGAFGMPGAVVRIYSDGRVLDPRTGERPASIGADVVQLHDRWVARLPVPETVIVDGAVQIGMVREDGCGARSSWPRRMLPGQVEPGRVSVRVSSWNGYENR